ncbi:MAG TPA: hypothetical protein VHL53_07195 [Acidimicrobiia bacterium]|nr:hypothetical protein [Acidimicrobiia bacterium]
MATVSIASAWGHRFRVLAAGSVLVFVLGTAAAPAGAAGPVPPNVAAPDRPVRPSLQPTTTCPPPAVDQLQRAIDFVQGRTWADKPGNTPLNLSPDLIACTVTLNVGPLSKTEEAALQAGAGPRLAIVHHRDFAKPSRVLLILWVVFGGSGLVWMFRRYARG